MIQYLYTRNPIIMYSNLGKYPYNYANDCYVVDLLYHLEISHNLAIISPLIIL